MNRNSYGKKCKCGHFEGEHQSKKKSSSIESVTQDYAYIIPPAEFPSEFIRGPCRICNCNMFNPEKKT